MGTDELSFPEAFWKGHTGLRRQGPGSDRSTKIALSMVDLPGKEAEILDIGCGPGAQTVFLAAETGGRVTAVDLFARFLEEVRERAGELGVADRVSTVRADMGSLPFDDKSFDLVWSEGAIYIMGFQSGLSAWKRFVKPGGYVAVTEITWLVDDPSDDASLFWKEAYPGMGTFAENCAAAREAGYQLVGTYTLPREDWWTDYYRPLSNRLTSLLPSYPPDSESGVGLREELKEIEIHRLHGNEYSYIFYVLRRPE